MRAAPTLAWLATAFAIALTGAARPLAAQESARATSHDDPDRTVRGGGSLPAGWSARADGNAGLGNVKVAPMGKGMHVTLGPAIILYRTGSAGSGPFHTLATFTQTRNPAHPEGYGLLYGGQAL